MPISDIDKVSVETSFLLPNKFEDNLTNTSVKTFCLENCLEHFLKKKFVPFLTALYQHLKQYIIFSLLSDKFVVKDFM